MSNTNDLDIAKKLRDENSYTIAVVNEGNTIYTSTHKGILPLYKIYDDKIDLSHASAADKVIGKGAAMFMVHFGVKNLDTYVISKSALAYLQEHNVVVSYSELVDYIINRNKDGKCPVETAAETVDDFDAFLENVVQLLKRWELI